MGWRDRIKKSFEDFEGFEKGVSKRKENSFANYASFAKGVQNLKKTEKERKEGPKVFFNTSSHNSQYSQKPPNGVQKYPNGAQNASQYSQNSKIEKKRGVDCKSNIPAPNPPGLGPEYEKIWNQAWRLADFIDGDTAPYADRKKRMPELLRLVDRMTEIETSSTTTRDRTPDYCPARCKRTGKCHGATWFTGKAGKASVCVSVCPWAEQLLKQHFEKDKKKWKLV